MISGLALLGGTVIDGKGGRINDAAVVLEDGRVTAVGPRGSTAVPASATVIDTSGKTVMPGLIDAHVHLATYSLSERQDFAVWGLVTSPDLKLLHGVHNARRTIEAGITTVRNMGGPDGVALRDAIAMGIIPGPRVVTSGSIGMTAGHGDMFTPRFMPRRPGATADGPDECRKAVRERVRMGADFIKVTTTGGVMSSGDAPEWRNFTLGEIEVICDEAHALGRRVASHAQVPNGIKNAILGGVDSIEHGNVLDDECIELMLERNVFLVPTLAVVYQIIKHGEEAGAHREGLEKARRMMDLHRASMKKAFAAGVKIAMGTDAAFNFCRNGDNALELELLTEIGMTPAEAIQAGTGKAAECIGLGGEAGTLTPGKRADVLVVDGDPEADIRILQDTSKILMVIQQGRVAVNRS